MRQHIHKTQNTISKNIMKTNYKKKSMNLSRLSHS